MSLLTNINNLTLKMRRLFDWHVNHGNGSVILAVGKCHEWIQFEIKVSFTT